MSHGLNDDFRDLLLSFLERHVRFIIVGAHALAVHGLPRATGDLDVFVEASPENARRVVAALGDFGAPLALHGVRQADFEIEGTVYQVGLPPRRVDILTGISGVTFDEAWADHCEAKVDGLALPFLGYASLVRNKRSSGRQKDLADLAALEPGRD